MDSGSNMLTDAQAHKCSAIDTVILAIYIYKIGTNRLSLRSQWNFGYSYLINNQYSAYGC